MRGMIRAAMGVALVVAFGVLLETPFAHAQNVTRFAANFQSHPEFSTNVSTASGGATFYNQTVKVPANINVLFVTISAAGDTASNAQLLLNCQVDFTNCKSTALGAANSAPSNWVNLLVDGSGTDSEDHSFSYTWCTPIRKGPSGLFHEVKINAASSNASSVFFERALVTIDGVKVADPALACTPF